MSEWIRWHGETGVPPVDDATRVNVLLRTGEEAQGPADRFSWKHRGSGGDIVRYQIDVNHVGDPLDIPVPSIDGMLADRGKRYGKFTGHANITQGLKCLMRGTPQWLNMGDDQKECLEMVAHKIGRILAGDPDFRDHWDDIAGYAKLVAERCTK